MHAWCPPQCRGGQASTDQGIKGKLFSIASQQQYPPLAINSKKLQSASCKICKLHQTTRERHLLPSRHVSSSNRLCKITACWMFYGSIVTIRRCFYLCRDHLYSHGLQIYTPSIHWIEQWQEAPHPISATLPLKSSAGSCRWFVPGCCGCGLRSGWSGIVQD